MCVKSGDFQPDDCNCSRFVKVLLFSVPTVHEYRLRKQSNDLLAYFCLFTLVFPSESESLYGRICVLPSRDWHRYLVEAQDDFPASVSFEPVLKVHYELDWPSLNFFSVAYRDDIVILVIYAGWLDS